MRALESGTVIMEMKDGAYETIRAEDVKEMIIRDKRIGILR